MKITAECGAQTIEQLRQLAQGDASLYRGGAPYQVENANGQFAYAFGATSGERGATQEALGVASNDEVAQLHAGLKEVFRKGEHPSALATIVTQVATGGEVMRTVEHLTARTRAIAEQIEQQATGMRKYFNDSGIRDECPNVGHVTSKLRESVPPASALVSYIRDMVAYGSLREVMSGAQPPSDSVCSDILHKLAEGGVITRGSLRRAHQVAEEAIYAQKEALPHVIIEGALQLVDDRSEAKDAKREELLQRVLMAVLEGSSVTRDMLEAAGIEGRLIDQWRGLSVLVGKSNEGVATALSESNFVQVSAPNNCDASERNKIASLIRAAYVQAVGSADWQFIGTAVASRARARFVGVGEAANSVFNIASQFETLAKMYRSIAPRVSSQVLQAVEEIRSGMRMVARDSSEISAPFNISRLIQNLSSGGTEWYGEVGNASFRGMEFVSRSSAQAWIKEVSERAFESRTIQRDVAVAGMLLVALSMTEDHDVMRGVQSMIPLLREQLSDASKQDGTGHNFESLFDGMTQYIEDKLGEAGEEATGAEGVVDVEAQVPVAMAVGLASGGGAGAVVDGGLDDELRGGGEVVNQLEVLRRAGVTDQTTIDQIKAAREASIGRGRPPEQAFRLAVLRSLKLTPEEKSAILDELAK